MQPPRDAGNEACRERAGYLLPARLLVSPGTSPGAGPLYGEPDGSAKLWGAIVGALLSCGKTVPPDGISRERRWKWPGT